MTQKEYRAILIGDESAFNFVNTKTCWTKEFYTKADTGNLSDIPVYTATKNPVAHVKISNSALITPSPNNPIISFGANGDGSAGTNFVFHTKPFYVSNDRTCIKVVDKNISSEYVYYILRKYRELVFHTG